MRLLLTIGLMLVFVARPFRQAAFAAGTNSPTPEYKPTAVAHQVEIARYDWRDVKRDRKVPAKIYFPKTGGPFPVIIFSHGLGGSREGYEYLGRYWAGHGYVSMHLQHPGSDSAVWENGPRTAAMASARQAAANPANAINRPLDVSFALDQLARLNREDAALKGRLDLERVGMAGHSFGAFTTLAIAGQVFPTPDGREIAFADPRVKAALPMSAPVLANKAALAQVFGKIKIPCLHMTGTEDSSPIGDTRPEERRLPFDHISGADQFLLTLAGGDHSVFSGRSRTLPPEREKLFTRLICESSTAFWNAYLKNDARAKTWLAGGGFKTELGSNGTFEEKLPGKVP